jgi:hypothetical protein
MDILLSQSAFLIYLVKDGKLSFKKPILLALLVYFQQSGFEPGPFRYFSSNLAPSLPHVHPSNKNIVAIDIFYPKTFLFSVPEMAGLKP